MASCIQRSYTSRRDGLGATWQQRARRMARWTKHRRGSQLAQTGRASTRTPLEGRFLHRWPPIWAAAHRMRHARAREMLRRWRQALAQRRGCCGRRRQGRACVGGWSCGAAVRAAFAVVISLMSADMNASLVEGNPVERKVFGSLLKKCSRVEVDSLACSRRRQSDSRLPEQNFGPAAGAVSALGA